MDIRPAMAARSGSRKIILYCCLAIKQSQSSFGNCEKAQFAELPQAIELIWDRRPRVDWTAGGAVSLLLQGVRSFRDVSFPTPEVYERPRSGDAVCMI